MNMSMNPAFEVKVGSNYDPSKKEPTSGEEYLQWVIYERKLCPEIVTVPVDNNKIRQCELIPQEIYSQTKPICRRDLIPTVNWQRMQVTYFKKLRQKVKKSLKKLSLNESLQEMQELILNALEDKNHSSYLFQLHDPSLDIVSGIDQGRWFKLFSHMVDHFVDIECTHIDDTYLQFQDKILSYDHLCLWLYAGLVCLKLPLEPAMHDLLRQLARACARIRALQGSDVTFLDTAHLSIPICIIGRYFNQRDLID